jgi:SAM-dependent methyltransferase
MLKAMFKNALPRPFYERIRRNVRYGFADLADSLSGRREGLVPPRRLNFVGGPDYKATGDEFMRYFTGFAGLEPHHRVLDVGCGIGRMARPLTGYLAEDGSYDGFDIDRTGIDWCNANISPRFPAFHFQRVDVFNKHYNPKGSIKASEYRFPFADGHFDLVFLTSVFTHMYPEDVEHYMGEIRRVLKPGGTCLITWFLWNAEAETLSGEKKAQIRFDLDFGSYRAVDRHVSEDAVSFKEKDVLSLYRRNHLDVKPPIHYGGWCGRAPFLSFQDIVIARKAAL